MPYNDDETRKDEERFREHLEKARSLTEEDMKMLMTNMEVLTAAALKLKAKSSLTEEDAALLARMKNTMTTVTETITNMQLILGESTKRQAYAYYHHIKKLAEEGNAEALKIYENLKPAYQASLRSDIGDN